MEGWFHHGPTPSAKCLKCVPFFSISLSSVLASVHNALFMSKCIIFVDGRFQKEIVLYRRGKIVAVF